MPAVRWGLRQTVRRLRSGSALGRRGSGSPSAGRTRNGRAAPSVGQSLQKTPGAHLWVRPTAPSAPPHLPPRRRSTHNQSHTPPLFSDWGPPWAQPTPPPPPRQPHRPHRRGQRGGGGFGYKQTLSSRPPGGGLGGGQEGSRLPLAQQEGGGLPRTAEGMQSSPIWSQCLPAPPRDAPPHSAGLVPTAPLRDSRGGWRGGGAQQGSPV